MALQILHFPFLNLTLDPLLIDIIIPVFNEEKAIRKTLQTIFNHTKGYIGEIYVIDGGSTDRTKEIVMEFPKVNLVMAPEKGRSKQLNFGASLCKNEILYFLHADSLPPEGFDEAIVQSVNKGFTSGCFRMKFDNPHKLLQFTAWLTRFNNSLCRGGDQSMFVTKKVFEDCGRFDEKLVIYEDNEILERIFKISKFDVIQKDIITSARRFEENGIVNLYFVFMNIHAAYRLGLPHDKLLKYYKKNVK